MLYSWSGGLGTNYLSLYACYLASPLNLITVLFPKEYLTEAVLILTLLKIGLAGLCFNIYIKGVHREQQGLINVAFSTLYALSGYVMAFSWNIMWMDAIYLFPLIMLGLVRLVRDKRGIFYCITLAIALFSNFYMAMFICIFTIVYYPVCLFSYHNIKKPVLLLERTAKFVGFSLLSAGLSAVLLMPTYFSLKLSSAADDNFPGSINQYYNLFYYITRHFTAAIPNIRQGMPNIYSGIVVLILIPLYFIAKGINLKVKLMHLALIIFLIASFNTNVLNFIWNGFHYPNQIPYRFSFVYIFLILSMGYEAFKKMNEFTGKQIAIISVLILGAIFISRKFDDLTLVNSTVYLSIAFIVLYAVGFTLNKYTNIRQNYKIIIIFMVIIAEVMVNTMITVKRINSAENYEERDGYSSGKEVKQTRDQISSIAANDKGFFRLEVIPPKTANDPFLYNYRGLSLFSSTTPKLTVKLFDSLGFSSNTTNSYKYEGSTPILDSIFGIKYMVYRSSEIKDTMYEQIATADNIKVFRNPYALTLGFQSLNELKNFHGIMSNPFDTQNKFINSICGVKDILVPISQKPGTLSNLTYSSVSDSSYNFKRNNKDYESAARIQFMIEKDQQVYLYYKLNSFMLCTGYVKINDKKIVFLPNRSTIINLGFCKSGTVAEMNIDFKKDNADSGTFEVYSYALDQVAFEKAMTILSKRSMTVENFKDTNIRGSINAESDGLMVMSIPYDKGWHVKVDNKEVGTQAIDNCLLSFDIAKGSHSIELRYIPDKFIIGLVITLVSIFILLFIIIIDTIFRSSRRCTID
jgi:Predicted membrane protein